MPICRDRSALYEPHYRARIYVPALPDGVLSSLPTGPGVPVSMEQPLPPGGPMGDFGAMNPIPMEAHPFMPHGDLMSQRSSPDGSAGTLVNGLPPGAPPQGKGDSHLFTMDLYFV